MKIQQMKQGKKIIISMIHKEKMCKAEATVLTNYEDGVLITPVYCDGELVDLCKSASVEYEDSITGAKHIFKVDRLRSVNFAGAEFNVVSGNEITTENNKRKAARYEINAQGTVHINGKVPASVTIHDISLRGLAFMTGGYSKYNLGDTVRVMFYKDRHNGRIDVTGTVARVFKLSGHEAVGITLNNFSTDYITYVMKKRSDKLGVEISA